MSYLITYVKNLQDKPTCSCKRKDLRFDSIVTDETPAQWLLGVGKRLRSKGFDVDTHIINAVEIPEDEDPDLAYKVRKHVKTTGEERSK